MLLKVFPTEKGFRDPCGKQGEDRVGSIPGPTFLLQPKALSSFQPKQHLPPSAFLLNLLVYLQQIVIGGPLSGQTLARDTVMNKTDGVTFHSESLQYSWGKASNNKILT